MVIYELVIIFQLITCREVMFQALRLHTGENYIHLANFQFFPKIWMDLMFSQACVKNSVHGGCTPLPPGRHPPRLADIPPDGHCSGRYASYWNAFLFVNFSWQGFDVNKSVCMEFTNVNLNGKIALHEAKKCIIGSKSRSWR